jgi:hypothetical protein
VSYRGDLVLKIACCCWRELVVVKKGNIKVNTLKDSLNTHLKPMFPKHFHEAENTEVRVPTWAFVMISVILTPVHNLKLNENKNIHIQTTIVIQIVILTQQHYGRSWMLILLIRQIMQKIILYFYCIMIPYKAQPYILLFCDVQDCLYCLIEVYIYFHVLALGLFCGGAAIIICFISRCISNVIL